MSQAHWKIVIEGTGPHHEQSTSDADQLARDLIRDLKVKGHTVKHARFTPGGPDQAADDLGVIPENDPGVSRSGGPLGPDISPPPTRVVPAVTPTTVGATPSIPPEGFSDTEIDAMSKDELADYARVLGITVKRADGSAGEPLKEDYVKALKKAHS